MTSNTNTPKWSYISNWLFIIATLIAMMVVVGGLTRLTGSGLSITEWKPLYGAIPPLNNLQWAHEFEAYKKIPQFQHINALMTLSEFKYIYWWEWGHRQLGRLIGLVFFLPMLFFWLKNAIPQGYKPVIILLFIGGGLQGLIGWLMVKSGLVDRLYVSHYRLAMHLGMALFLYYFVVHTAILLYQRRFFELPKWSPTVFLTLCIFIQIISGALTAGIHAGHIYNTWPLMDGAFIPNGIFSDQLMGMQFMHRMLAYIVIIIASWVAYQEYRQKNYGAALLIVSMVTAQITLGIVTLILIAPVNHIEIAALHQFGSIILLTGSAYLNSRQSYY